MAVPVSVLLDSGTGVNSRCILFLGRGRNMRPRKGCLLRRKERKPSELSKCSASGLLFSFMATLFILNVPSDPMLFDGAFSSAGMCYEKDTRRQFTSSSI